MQGPACVPWELVEALAAEAAPPPPPPPPGASPGGAAAGEARPSGAAPPGGYRSRLLVERWLSDKGVAFRRKEQPDGRGRTVWVLAECPFDASHGDPDSCVMQAADGKLSAQCFHDSCQGRGWQHFKAAIGPPEAHHYDPPLEGRKAHGPGTRQAGQNGSAAPPGSGPPPEDCGDGGDESGLPRIQGNRRQLRDVSADALAALVAANDPPCVFGHGGSLSRIRLREDGGAPTLEPLSDAALRGVLARCADWVLEFVGKRGSFLVHAPPPAEAVRDLASLPAWPGVPPIDAVAECPVVAPDGSLALDEGYRPSARLWLHLGGLEIPPVPEIPTAEDVAEARNLLLEDLLVDFPFAEEASRAHALACLLLPFVRPLVAGPTPLHLIDAPTEGTGKTLLATVLALVSTGRAAEAVAEAASDEEWRKRITALLAEGPALVLLDNLSRPLDSGALASALTCTAWKDRLLGHSRTVSFPARCVWIATGNNAQLSREMLRRTVWVRLDAQVGEPWERTGFRHPDLPAWVRQNRGRLVHAALVLCRAWLAAGRPPGKRTLGSYEEWARVLGGILEVAGVPGLLDNAGEHRSRQADAWAEWPAFVQAWLEENGEDEVGTEVLHALASGRRLLDPVLGDGGERSQRTRLGQALAKAAGRAFGAWQVERAGQDHCRRQRWRLVYADGGAAPGGDGG